MKRNFVLKKKAKKLKGCGGTGTAFILHQTDLKCICALLNFLLSAAPDVV